MNYDPNDRKAILYGFTNATFGQKVSQEAQVKMIFNLAVYASGTGFGSTAAASQKMETMDVNGES